MSDLLILKRLNKEPKTDITDWLITRYIVGVLGAWCAELVTFPLDLTKTRLQIQNEVAASSMGANKKMEYRGLLSTALHIVTEEGPLKLYSGLGAMCQRHALYAGSRVLIYERLRKMIGDETGRMGLPQTLLCGATVGAIAQFISSPADLVKVQMQAEGRRVLQGHKPRFKTSLEGYRKIYRESGIIGFWRGAVPCMYRASLVNVGDLASYDYAKQFLKRQLDMHEGVPLHLCAAFVAGFNAALLSTPADVLKTRVMNQPLGPDGKGLLYKGMTDCFRQSLKNEGFFALYKGFIPTWMRLGPWALVNWLAFERIMYIIGGKAF